MTVTVLDPQALEGHIPHRGVNLIPDQVELSADGMVSRSETRLQPGDDRGRECFRRRGADGEAYWNEPFLAELLALTGVPLLTSRLASEHKVAVFSTISRLQVLRPVPLYGALEGHAEITRERAGFFQFVSRLVHDGEEVYRGEIMSGAATLDEIAAGGGGDQAALPAGEPLATWDWKPAAMRFIDAVLEFDADEPRLAARYTYPADHPFVVGHFPGAPLMMGVTQWAAIADAGIALVQRLGLGDGSYIGQGRIRRPDGTEVVNIRDFEVVIQGGVPRVGGLKRLAFREVVRPGDQVVVEATLDQG